ncbi:hypothetical protein ACFY00_15010 [Kitasatospora sp. NPDC001540]|uniref:hypothetical protein n=1 Tax=Kitasatospora sp. NPDC001540 TaxID=3364014 RepID=UPI00367BFC33
MSTQDTPAEQGPEQTASTPHLHDNPPTGGPDGEAPDGPAESGWHDADGTPHPGDREEERPDPA